MLVLKLFVKLANHIGGFVRLCLCCVCGFFVYVCLRECWFIPALVFFFLFVFFLAYKQIQSKYGFIGLWVLSFPGLLWFITGIIETFFETTSFTYWYFFIGPVFSICGMICLFQDAGEDSLSSQIKNKVKRKKPYY